MTKRSWVLVGALLGLGACLLETKNVPGEAGDPGAKGDPGPAGSVDPATLAALEAKISALETKVEALEKQSVDPDCPVGYVRAANEPAGSPPPVHCQKGDPVFDEVVKVGSGGSAFWIDRFEASVWQNADGTGNQFFKDSDDDSGVLSTFPKNGQWTGLTAPVRALSRSGVTPGRYITWFQANEACRASQKHLPTGDEWLSAARGTVDPGGSPGDGGKCVTGTNAPRATGGGTACRSQWGAEDMIGNLNEFTSEWYAGVGALTDLGPQVPWSDTIAYGNDATYNIMSSAYVDGAPMIGAHSPSVAIRGGDWGDGPNAGLFALSLAGGPSLWGQAHGFRCVIPR